LFGKDDGILSVPVVFMLAHSQGISLSREVVLAPSFFDGRRRTYRGRIAVRVSTKD
jgi:hypothetical protein